MKNTGFLLIVVAATGCNDNPAGFAAPDPEALKQYYECLAAGNFPTAGREERLVARALELAEQSGHFIRLSEELDISGQAGVPTLIKLEGQEIIIDDNLYTPAERLYLGLAVELAKPLR